MPPSGRRHEAMIVPPGVRRANRMLLIAMALFAVALGAACLWWMYGRMARQRADEERDAAAARLRTTDNNRPAAVTPANPSPSPVAPR